MMAISDVTTLTKYYEIFHRKKQAGEHNLKIATIFSFAANEPDKDADGMLDDDPQLNLFNQPKNTYARDKLEEYIADYNQMFGSNYTTKDSKSFYDYYRNIADRVKAREIDLLLVVNMFLTGFDSKTLNTLYVDKNLRYHGLIQAYSRTNRILNETKSQGNIVVFRNLKKATDDALSLFANKQAREEIFLEPYEVYLQQFNNALANLQQLAPTPQAVDNLPDEAAEKDFVEAFRLLLRLKNVLISFTVFSNNDIAIDEQTFENYKGKYLDIYDKTKNDQKEKVSILGDIDFELELTRRDEVNVSYILQLIGQMVGANRKKQAEIKQNVLNVMANNAELRSKRELIEKFIESTIPQVSEASNVEQQFAEFLSEEQTKAFQQLCKEEGLDANKVQELLDWYMFSGRMPEHYDLETALISQPKISERKDILQNVGQKIKNYINIFIEGI